MYWSHTSCRDMAGESSLLVQKGIDRHLHIQTISNFGFGFLDSDILLCCDPNTHLQQDMDVQWMRYEVYVVGEYGRGDWFVDNYGKIQYMSKYKLSVQRKQLIDRIYFDTALLMLWGLVEGRLLGMHRQDHYLPINRGGGLARLGNISNLYGFTKDRNANLLKCTHVTVPPAFSMAEMASVDAADTSKCIGDLNSLFPLANNLTPSLN